VAKIWVKRTGLGLVVMMIVLNLFLYSTSRLNEDRIPGYGDWRMLSVLTGSMAPQIDAGDMVIVTRYGAGEEPRVGDIVTYWRDEQTRSLITHRVIQSLDNGYLQTKGDANIELDGGWTDPDRLVGKVVFTIPYAAALQQFSKEPLVMAGLLAAFAAWLFCSQRKPVTRQQNSSDTTVKIREACHEVGTD